jgi:hypothetical protein
MSSRNEESKPMILNVVRAHMELMLKIKAQLMIHRQEEFSDKGPHRD